MSFWRPGEAQPPSSNPTDAAPKEAPKADSKAQLSQSVLTMKFMKRKETEAEAAREVKRKVDETQWRLKRKPVTSDQRVRVAVAVEDKDHMAMYPGRRSFCGYNAFIEQAYKRTLHRNKIQRSTEIEQKNTVSDQEMLDRFQKYVGVKAQQQEAKKKRKKRT